MIRKNKRDYVPEKEWRGWLSKIGRSQVFIPVFLLEYQVSLNFPKVLYYKPFVFRSGAKILGQFLAPRF